MIHVDIGTTGNAEGKGALGYLSNSENEFLTADEAVQFLLPYQSGMDEKDWATILDVLQGCRESEYVDPEMEIRSRDGHYTNLIISIEGRQDPNWQVILDETKRAMNYLMTDGAFVDTDVSSFLEMLNGAYAVANAITKKHLK